MNVIRLAFGTPTARGGAVHERLQDQAMRIVDAVVRSQLVASQRTTDKYTIGQLPAFAFVGRVAEVQQPYVHLGQTQMLWQAAHARDQEGRAGIDWLLMCDSDNWTLNGGGVLEMIASGRGMAAAVIGAPVLGRHGAYNVIADAPDGTPFVLRRAESHGKITPVRRIGSAFMAVSLHWLRDHWPWTPEDPWFQPRWKAGSGGFPELESHDFQFCDGVRSRGGLILCDWRLEPRHDGITYPEGTEGVG